MSLAQQLQDKGPRRLDVLRLLETAPTALLLVAEDGGIVYANLLAARLLGIGRNDLVGADIRLFHAQPGQHERLAASFRAAGTLKNAQVALRRIGAANFLAELTWEESQFNGQPVDALWLTDITGRRANEDLLTRLFDWAPLPLLLCRLQDGMVLKANRRAVELFISGRSGNCLLGDAVSNASYKTFRNRLRGGGFIDDFEVVIRTAYGETYPGTLSGQLLVVEDERCILVGLSDITDRKRAEETLTRFFEGAPLAMLLVRLRDNAVLRLNRRASELLAVQGQPGIETGHHRLDKYVGLSSQSAFLEELAKGGFVDGYEALLNTDYGESVWTILSGQAVQIEEERCVLIGITDITDRITAERLMRRAEEEAVRANQAKSLFLATMSHEIRTPMNGVLGMLDVLATTAMSSEQEEMVGIVRNSARTLLTIIDDILDLSKIEAGKLRLERLPVVLRDVVESTAELMTGRAQEKGVELGWHVAGDLPAAVLGDPTRLRQILLNLLGNAVKFTQQGWVVLRVRGAGRGEALRFEVEDTGIGISAEQQARLFQPFSQADTSTTRRFGGTGLGLSICRRLVSLMGGRIGLDSAEGRGSLFWFEIPVEEAVVEIPPLPAGLSGLRVLLAEDLAETRDSLAALLQQAGGAVRAVADEAAGLALLERDGEAFDLALVDADGGFAALAGRLAALLPPGRLLPMSRGAGAGAVGLLGKPVRRSLVLRRIAQALGQAEAELLPAGLADATAARAPLRPAPTVAEALAAGRLILVAEDNATNRQVIGRQLARLGHACEIAEDGEIAWSMLQRKPYALLLTDCSMPNLDGYGLTARIRAAEKSGTARLPILALTAHAQDSDAEHCRQAGMDDYLSKPIALDRLGQMLDRWLPSPAEGTAPVPSPAPAGKAEAAEGKTAPPVDLAALGALLGDDDPDTLREILGSFIESFDEILQRLHAALAAGDHKGLRDNGHAGKGASRNACAPLLAGIMESLESRAKAVEPLPALAGLLAAAETEFARVRAMAGPAS